MLKLAKNLALTSDCLNEANQRQEFLISETEVLTRKADKARLQIEQEKVDKEIIIQDLNRVNQAKEKLVASGKASFKRRVSKVDDAAAAASKPSRRASASVTR